MGRPKGRTTTVRSITLDNDVDKFLESENNASGLINSLVKMYMQSSRPEEDKELRERIARKLHDQQKIERQYEVTTELLGFPPERKLVELLPSECKRVYDHIMIEKKELLYHLKKTGKPPVCGLVDSIVAEAEWILNVEIVGDKVIRRIIKKAVEKFDVESYEKEVRRSGKLSCQTG